MTAYEARHVRPYWEVESLLMSAIAEAQFRQRGSGGETSTPIIENPEGEPAPAWVNDLPVT